MKLTPWYSNNIRPIRSGVYLVCSVDDSIKPWYRYFDGKSWFRGWYTPDGALYEHRNLRKEVKTSFLWGGLRKPK
jgi:hypothetical protein